MDLNVIIDRINIKEFPEIICQYMRDNSIKKYNNLRSFYNGLYDLINEDVKNSYLNRTLKYMSSDTPSLINIIEDFNEGIYDEELMTFAKDICKYIKKGETPDKLYETLLKEVKLTFFDKDYNIVVEAYNDGFYDSFIFYLLKHAFLKYHINLPGIMAKRLMEQALTLAYNTNHRNMLLKAASSLGNEEATFFVADYVCSQDKDECCKYFIKLKNNPTALWCMAYELENNHLKNETVELIKKELDYILLDESLSKNIKLTDLGKKKYDDQTMLYAIRMYQYMINEFNFTKAYNSLGKLLINKFIYIEGTDSIKAGLEYLKVAVGMGNYNAITNIAIFYYQNPEYSELSHEEIMEYLKLAADLGDVIGSKFYGKLLLDDGNTKDGIKYLEYASDLKSGEASFFLGKYYSTCDDSNNTIKYYKQAILNNYYDAAYYLALYYLEINIYDKHVNDELVKNILAEHLNHFSDEVSKKAHNLYENLNL